MAITAHRLTYEDYVCGPEEMRRYDILDGEKVYMPNPTIRHQEIEGNLYLLLRAWHRKAHPGKLLMAPCDVLISRGPLRTRQPDILFISQERLGSRSLDDPAPLEPAPELVIEILSPSDTRRALSGKLADYRTVHVQECWIVSPGEQTVEILNLAMAADESLGIFRIGQTLTSGIYSDLSIDVSDVFAE